MEKCAEVWYSIGDGINAAKQRLIELLYEDAQMNGAKHGSPKSGYWKIV